MIWVIAFQFCSALAPPPNSGRASPNVQTCEWQQSPHPKFSTLDQCETFRSLLNKRSELISRCEMTEELL